MPVDIEDALRGGIARTLENGGLTIAGAFFVLGTLNALLAVGAANWRGGRMGLPWVTGDPYGVPIGLPPVLVVVASLLVWLATVIVTIAAIRLFVGDDRDRVEQALFTRNSGWAGVNYVVGGVVFGVVVGIGFVLLVVPGVFLLVSLIFWAVVVAVDDENFVEAMRRSWRLVAGHRWSLLGLGFVVAVIGLVVSAVFSGFGLLVRGVTGLLVAQAGAALTTTFTAATLATAYRQLLAREAEGPAEPAEA